MDVRNLRPDRAAITAVVSRYRARGAVREVGKALGVPEDVTGGLARLVWGWSDEGVGDAELKELNLNPEDHRLRLTLEFAKQLIDTPRHLSQHPGGFVLTLDRLDELVPIEPAAMDKRQVIEWDKDDIDALKFMKVDVLGLGMLGCMRRAFELLEGAKGLFARSGDHSGRRRRHLRDDPQGRHRRRLPDRKPRANVDAAAHGAEALL